MARNTISFIVFLVTLHMNLNLVRATTQSYTMPASCNNNGLSYCFDKGDNYPDEKIDELLKDMRQLLQQVEAPQIRSIGSRNGDTYDEPDCPSNSTIKPIHYIIDENNKVRVVVQSPKKFEQIFSVKWCSKEGRITDDTSHFLRSTTLEQFNIECVNTKMNFDIFVLSEDQLKLQIARAKGGIPVCCRCRYNADK